MHRRIHGQRVRLGYRGRTHADRRVHGEAAVIGEDPACSLVVPGPGPATTLARGDTLLGAPGLAGTVPAATGTIPFAGPCPLRPGDRAAENSLDALHAAATPLARRPSDTTLRLVVHATDDDFSEAPTVPSVQTVQPTCRETAAAMRIAAVRVFSFAARVGGPCECLDVRRSLRPPSMHATP